MPYECGASCLLDGASCLLNGANCLLNAGSTCLRTSFLWGELSCGDLSLGRIFRNPYSVKQPGLTLNMCINIRA